jgi:glycosyltransferase involved in cell wall biosynthesis
MKVAITGTRGIPNYYGGFEQFAEYLALGLVKRGFEVIVYNSHNHPYQEKQWNGVKLIHCYDPEAKLGTAGQFIYDFNCNRDVRKRDCDVILQLGYTSSSIWGWMLPKKSVITTNMDGLEWKRTKFSERVKRFLKYAEKLAIKKSDYLISDSLGIQDYLKREYNAESVFIAYGATLFDNPKVDVLQEYNLLPFEYDLLIARLEPENSIEIILDGIVKANLTRPFLVIGKHETSFGKYLKNKYSSNYQIKFLGGIYNIDTLNSLRHYSNIYFHGHTVGGTNPSLLEAMASSALICANDNPFNRYVLNEDALYFNCAKDVSSVLLRVDHSLEVYKRIISNNRDKISKIYDWELIVDQYVDHFMDIKGKRRRR